MAVETKEIGTIGKGSHEKYLNDPDFQKLESTRNKIVVTLTALTLIVYYGFILLMAYGKSVLSTKLSSNVTIGLPIGVFVIVISWVFVYVYARWANNSYDRMVEKIKEKMGG